VTFHGVSLNVDPDLSHFGGIVPCGISQHGVTSLHALGQAVTLPEADMALRAAWDEVFGPGSAGDAPDAGEAPGSGVPTGGAPGGASCPAQNAAGLTPAIR
jgi:lipoyl(octanoyl) transferase